MLKEVNGFDVFLWAQSSTCRSVLLSQWCMQ